MRTRHLSIALALTLATAGCSGEELAAEAVAVAAPVEAPAAAPSAPAPAAREVEPTGEIIEVKMISDGAEQRFEPAEIVAQPGDVLRYTLVSGVHNVSFPANRNAGVADALPAPSRYLTTAGETYDVAVDMPAGTYEFQCDPHVAMGMVGTLTVQ